MLPAQAAARAMLNGLYPKSKAKAKAKPKATAKGTSETHGDGDNTA